MNAQIKKGLARPLGEHGFRQKGNTWYLDCPETILVAHLQKSRFGGDHYVNLAIWLKKLGKADFPKEHHCHIRTRLDSVGSLPGLKRALDEDNRSISPEKRQAIAEKAMRKIGIPFLQSCSGVKEIKERFLAGKLENALVDRAVMTLIE